MCGISGLLAPRQSSIQRAWHVEAMNRQQLPRGPDAEGRYDGDRITLGHRRLAIVDLDPRANQPFASPCGRYVMVFNGEIYNYRELRDELRSEGISLRTRSDTEVLLQSYLRDGPALLSRLRGMFAFAVWDTANGSLFLARDPYGIKPLYYVARDGEFAFASTVRALRTIASMTPEPAGIVGFLLWGSVPEPWTTYRDIRALPAGHHLTIRADAPADTQQLVRWHRLADAFRPADSPLPPMALAERVGNALRESVKAHLVADVPLCLFLSGGVDSALVAALARENAAELHGVTLSYAEYAGRHDDEAPQASELARHYGLQHTVRRVDRREFIADLPHLLDAMDQPTTDGINTWFASKAVRELGYRVALSGIGGDELFCGYPSFRAIPRGLALHRLLRALPAATHVARPALRALGRWRGNPKHAVALDAEASPRGLYFLARAHFLPHEIAGLLPPEIATAGLAALCEHVSSLPLISARHDNVLGAVATLESSLYLRNQLLRDADWASMAHSVELRTPLVDAALVRALGPYVAQFAAGAGKQLQSATPRRPLPSAITQRRKTGFTLPMREWVDALPPARAEARLPASTAWSRRFALRLLEQQGPCASFM